MISVLRPRLSPGRLVAKLRWFSMRTFVSSAGAAALAVILAVAPRAAAAQTRPPAPPEGPTLAVSGEGTVSRSPDQAIVTAQIITNNDVAATATSQNNATYGGLRTRLNAIGIPESAIKTNFFNVNFIPRPADAASYKPPRTGYVVTRGLSITINELDAVGRAIDAAVAAGVTDVGGVSYGLRDRRAVWTLALAAAVRDAQTQAAAIAEAAHMRVAGVRTINAGGYFAPVPAPLQMAGRMSAAAAPNVPTEVQPSNIDVRATVSITFNLGQ